MKSNDVMRGLEEELGYTIALGILKPDSGFGTVLTAIDGTAGLTFHLQPGLEFDLHTAAPGKAMLAYLTQKERRGFYRHMTFDRFTPSTITDAKRFEAELNAVTEKGYAIDVSEFVEGCHCVGVPVFNSARRPVAAIWASGPAAMLPVHKFSKIANVLKRGAQEISSRLSSTRRSSDRKLINSIVQQAQEIIESNLHKPMKAEQLAKNLYVSYSWFRQAFKDQTGEAPSEYHLNRRIEKACGLLNNTDLAVKQISEELGFKNQNHFSALFKRKIGVSPLNYRETGK